FIITAMLLLLLSSANAQSWLLNGNSTVTDTSKLGSLNQKPVRFFTGNTQWMRLTLAGNLGIGNLTNSTPIDYRLTILGAKVLGVDNKASFSAKNSSGVY